MKPIYFIVACCFVCLSALAQQADDGVKLDLLKAPASPASNLLNIAVSDIDKPTDVSAFMLSLRQATSGFSALPTNYAVDIAPFWLKRRKLGDITTYGLADTTGANVFRQSFVLSMAIRNTDSTEKDLLSNTVYGALGFKFSIIRGKFDATTRHSVAAIGKWQAIQVASVDEKLTAFQKDSIVLRLQAKNKELRRMRSRLTESEVERRDSLTTEIVKVEASVERMMDELVQNSESEAKRKITEIASTFQLARVGFTWDVAGGFSGFFKNRSVNQSAINNAGIWTTLGYTSERAGSALFLARWLYNPDKVFALDNTTNKMADISTFDFGGRYVYGHSQSKFNASLEGVYRSILKSKTINPSWRIIFNADYALFPNQKLTFSFGRNFDGTIDKDGNLVAALSFLAGFGNKR